MVIVLSFGTFGRYFEYFDGMFGKGGEATIVNIVVGSEVRIYCGAGCRPWNGIPVLTNTKTKAFQLEWWVYQ